MGDIRISSKQARDLALLIVVLLTISVLAPARVVLASPPEAPPMQGPTPTPEQNPITQIINQIIQFPFENLTQALQNALQSILNNSVAPLETIFSASIGRWLTSSPGIVTPGGGIANGADVMGPAWRLMIKIAVLLWPLTLAIIAAIAAKDAVAAASWGIGDLKEALGGWLIAVIASATSLYWMDLANRFTNATTMTILDMSFTGEAGFQPNALTGLVFGTAGILLTYFAPPASLFIVIFVILLGLAVLTALIFQFMARFVVLYILVALAPVVTILGVLPPMRWFSYTWLRGFVLVEAVGPINALLLKLVMILTVRGASNDPISAFVNFMGALGVVSILLTIDGVIIKSVFGAVQEIAEKAMSTVTGIATLALAGATALAGGSIAAAGGVSAAGTAAGGGTGGAGGAGGASAALASAGSNGSGPVQAARSAFNPASALRGAGDVLFRQPGMLGSMGAAMRSLGGTMEQHERNQQANAHSQPSQAAHANATQPGNRGTPMPGTGGGGSNRSGGNQPPAPNALSTPGALSTPMSGPSTPGSGPTSPNASTSRAGASSGTPTSNSATMPTSLSRSSGNPNANSPGASTPNNTPPTGIPTASPATTAPPAAAGTVGDPNAGGSIAGAAVPPAQTPSMTPMGEPVRMTPSVPSGSLPPEAASALGLLPAPLRDRGASLALQSAPQDQAEVARASVEALSALEFSGSFPNPGSMAAAWDRGMAPVIASAREGLPLTTMAQDAGFGSNLAGYISHRMTHVESPGLEAPSQSVPWHPQLAPHDLEMGTAISHALGTGELRPGTAARLYHEIRSPESGGWSAGAQFVQTIQQALQGNPSDPIAVLHTRMTEMGTRGSLSPSAMALWRANVRGAR